MARIVLVGDYNSTVPAHRAIPLALERVRQETGHHVTWEWMATRDLRTPAQDLASASAMWLVPASPYENTDGVLAAIRWIRETQRPFLGTCGGFQHALIEFARNVLQISDADHTESNPSSAQPVVDRLACGLIEQSARLHFAPGSRIHTFYGTDIAHESYRCNYGFNVAYRAQFEAAGFQFTAFDDNGDPRAAELSTDVHPFFIGTLFQPERAALRTETPPLARGFVQAAIAFAP